MARRYFPKVTTAQRATVTFQEREMVFDVDEDRAYIGDGSTVGGIPLATGDADISTAMTPVVEAATLALGRAALGLSTALDSLFTAANVYVANLLKLANATWFQGRNAANSADLNLYRVNSANFLEFGVVRSRDSTSTHIDRSVLDFQNRYENASPTTIHNQFHQIIGSKGANGAGSVIVGTSHGYYLQYDLGSVVSDATRGAHYGVQHAINLLRDRSNTPWDDSVLEQYTNAGVGKITEYQYFGRGPEALASEAYCIFGVDAWADSIIGATGHYVNALDFHRNGTTAAQVTGAFLHVPNNTTAASARNAANSADVALVGSDSSDRLTLAGKAVYPHTQVTATPTPGTGSYTTAAGTLRYMVINGRCYFTWNGSITTVGTGATDLRFTVPFAAEAYTTGRGVRTSTDTPLVVSISAGSTTCIVRLAGGADPNGNYFYSVSGDYEIDV